MRVRRVRAGQVEQLTDPEARNYVVEFSWRPATMASFFASPTSSTSSAMVKLEFEVPLLASDARAGVRLLGARDALGRMPWDGGSGMCRARRTGWDGDRRIFSLLPYSLPSLFFCFFSIHVYVLL